MREDVRAKIETCIRTVSKHHWTTPVLEFEGNDDNSVDGVSKEQILGRLIGDHRLQPYFQYCQNELLVSTRCMEPPDRLQARLNFIIFKLRAEPDVSKQLLRVAMQESGHVSHDSEINEQDAMVASAVKVMMMLDCSGLKYSSHRLEKGTHRLEWHESVPFSKFVQDIFPATSHPALCFPDNPEHNIIKSALKATKLKKYLGLSLRPTNDLRDHLKLDRQKRVLEIFHHAAFLKQQLVVTKDLPRNSNFVDSIRLGAIPRQIALETLESLQGVLFPLTDKKSNQLLSKMIQSGTFDPETAKFDYGAIRNSGEENVPFYYLADRLSELHIELEDPRPHGWLERVCERRSANRYMLMATMIGVVLAVLLGITSLTVSAYQTWIAYQAWQHPVSPGSGNG